MHVSCVCATEYYITRLGHTGPSVFDLGQLRTLSTARSSLSKKISPKRCKACDRRTRICHGTDLSCRRNRRNRRNNFQQGTRQQHSAECDQSVLQQLSAYLFHGWIYVSHHRGLRWGHPIIHSFIRSFVHSIQFNSIQFNSFIHTYICITSTPWGREGFQPKRGYKQLQTELRNHRICNDEHLFLNNSSIIDVQLCVINYTVHPQD